MMCSVKIACLKLCLSDDIVCSRSCYSNLDVHAKNIQPHHLVLLSICFELNIHINHFNTTTLCDIQIHNICPILAEYFVIIIRILVIFPYICCRHRYHSSCCFINTMCNMILYFTHKYVLCLCKNMTLQVFPKCFRIFYKA